MTGGCYYMITYGQKGSDKEKVIKNSLLSLVEHWPKLFSLSKYVEYNVYRMAFPFCSIKLFALFFIPETIYSGED